jgi:hypothetical protein
MLTALFLLDQYTAGSPLLASFLDPALRSLFPSHISDASFVSSPLSSFSSILF